MFLLGVRVVVFRCVENRVSEMPAMRRHANLLKLILEWLVRIDVVNALRHIHEEVVQIVYPSRWGRCGP